MRQQKLPLALKLQIRAHFSYLWQRNSVWDQEEIMAELPTFLRNEVALHNNAAIIRGVPAFKDLDTQCLARVCIKLVLSRGAPGAFVVREGEGGNDAHFISSGTVALSFLLPEPVAEDLDVNPRVAFSTLSEGDSFAEYALVSQSSVTHPYSARSLSSAEILVLTTAAFLKISEEFPELEVAMSKLARARYGQVFARLLRWARAGIRRRCHVFETATPGYRR